MHKILQGNQRLAMHLFFFLFRINQNQTLFNCSPALSRRFLPKHGKYCSYSCFH